MTETKMQLADCKSQLELGPWKSRVHMQPHLEQCSNYLWLGVDLITDHLNLQGWMTYAYDSLLTCPRKSYDLFIGYAFKSRRPNGSTRTLFVLKIQTSLLLL